MAGYPEQCVVSAGCRPYLDNTTGWHYSAIIVVYNNCYVTVPGSRYDYFLASTLKVYYPEELLSINIGGNGWCSSTGSSIQGTTEGYEDWYVWNIYGSDAGRTTNHYFQSSTFCTTDDDYIQGWVYLPRGSAIHWVMDSIYQGRRGASIALGFNKEVPFICYGINYNFPDITGLPVYDYDIMTTAGFRVVNDDYMVDDNNILTLWLENWQSYPVKTSHNILSL